VNLTKFLLATFLVVATAALLSACNLLGEAQDHTYKDYQALDDAGEFEHGWAPDLLPESATDIHLKYDLDSNAILMAFEFDPADEAAVTRDCTTADQMLPPQLQAKWWPDDLLTDGAVAFYQCPQGNLAIRDVAGFFWSGVKTPPGAISIAELDANPKNFLDLDGQQVTVVGYVDFDNIHDLRETNYPQEAVGFVRKPGQTADSVFFAYFPPGSDPHPLFDELYALRAGHESSGLRLLVTGALRAYDQPTNFSNKTGYVIDVASPEDVVILR